MIHRRLSFALAGALLSLAATSAAGAQALCGAPAAEPGARLRGPVLHVLDSETFCLALGPTPDRWLQLRLSDAGEAGSGAVPTRGALMSVAFGRDVDCHILDVAEIGNQATCEREGRTLAARAREPKAARAGRGWR